MTDAGCPCISLRFGASVLKNMALCLRLVAIFYAETQWHHVRVEQKNGEFAWSSPICLKY